MKHLRTKLAAINTATNHSSLTEDAPPVEEVDLTGEDLEDLTKVHTNEEEVNPTKVLEVDDNEAEQEVGEMYSNNNNETED
jgi:hypothetical protein